MADENASSTADPVTAAIESSVAAYESSGAGSAAAAPATPAASADAGAASAAGAGGAAGAAASAASATGAGEAAAAAVAATDGATPPAAATAKPEEAENELTAEEQAGTVLPLNRHKAVVTNVRNKAAKQVEEVKAKYAAFDTQDFKEQHAAIQLAEHRPESFIKDVLMHDPRYKGFLHPSLFGEEVKTPPPAAAPAGTPAAAPAALTAKPEPDVLLSDGTLTYSQEKQEQLIQWHLQEASKRHGDEMKALRDELQPVLSEHKTVENLQKALETQAKSIDTAHAEWPGFTANFEEIKSYLLKPENKRKSLLQGYTTIMEGKRAKLEADLAAADTRARAKIIAEMNAAGQGNTVTPGSLPATIPAESMGSDVDPIELAVRNATRAAAAR